MAKSFTDYVQTVIVKKGLTGLFQCPALLGGHFYFAAEGQSNFATRGHRRLPSGVKRARLFHVSPIPSNILQKTRELTQIIE